MGFLAGLEAAQALGDEIRRPRYAFFLGRIALRQDDYAAAQELLGAAIDGFRANGNQARMAEAMVDLADVEFELGEYAEAQRHTPSTPKRLSSRCNNPPVWPRSVAARR